MDTTGLFERVGHDIAVGDVEKTFRSGEDIYRALQGVSSHMSRGKVTIIQGPSGCGKSTLLNILGSIDHPDRGSVQVGSFNLAKMNSEQELSRYRLYEIGFVFQAFNLISGLTALENLQLPMTVTGRKKSEQIERAHRLLSLVGMETKAKKRPDALSGGEQQRVALALALVNDPPVILADEPTGNLDTANARRVIDLLCVLARESGKTVVVTTHDPMIAERGDQILHMRDGSFEGPISVGR